MSTSTNMHSPAEFETGERATASWLTIIDGDRNSVTVFMHRAVAEALADVWERRLDIIDEADNAAEEAWEDYTSSPPDHGFYRQQLRDAGRGHLLKD